ncbi:MAG: hypothetical protein BroJett025_02080 [Patescibacteria group bacterium]|nr:MAG: hypothetical protein BroJett025_02080 [Patescibacteria group bacterium]
MKKKPIKISETSFQYTFEEIYGQHEAKRALEIAAAGGHNVLLTGPPGTGKSLLAKSIVSILPDLESEELLAVNSIYSISGLLDRNLISQRPFRTPHHTISSTAMIGGGKSLNPGEISLAHRGILFMDEFFEFPTNILESLRQPLEDGTITISRISGNSTYPCECMLIAASNPCPCGYRFSQMKTCSCTQNQYIAYKKKMSGPIIDRIDIRVFVQPVETKLLTTTSLQQNATSSDIRKKVGIARRIQVERYKDECILTNSQLTTRLISKFCNLTIEAEKLLKRSNQKYQLSTRSFFRIIKVAQTIADLSQKSEISVENIAEALQYRKLEL